MTVKNLIKKLEFSLCNILGTIFWVQFFQNCNLNLHFLIELLRQKIGKGAEYVFWK